MSILSNIVGQIDLQHYKVTTKRSVVVSLRALEENLNPDMVKILLKELNVNFLKDAHVEADLFGDGIVFYTLEKSK